MSIRPLGPEDRDWVRPALERFWGLPVVTPIGPVDEPWMLDGLVAEVDGEPAAVATYRIAGGECEVVTLHAEHEGIGAARAVLHALRKLASTAGCRRLWLITTDDNDRARRFYRSVGMREVAVHRGFVDVVSAHKPGVVGFQDAIELEWRIDEA